MGCHQSTLEDKINISIDVEQKHQKKELDMAVHILLMGTGDSGKTTLRKQLTNLHSKNYESDTYRLNFKAIVLSNLLEGASLVASDMEGADKTFVDDMDMLSRNQSALSSGLKPELVEKLQQLLAIPAFKEKSKHTDDLQDNFFQFSKSLQAYPTWGGESWVPTTEECIRSRSRTTGVVQEEFTIAGSLFKIYDVGGQRAERRKWLHSFENVQNVIFVTALSEYDQNLFEDTNKNRLVEAIELFKDAINSQWLKESGILLFLNKKDLFHIKLVEKKIPLNISGEFPDAPDDFNEVVAIKWVENQFRKVSQRPQDELLVHVTTAIDSNNVKAVFDACRDNMLRKNIAKMGL